MTTAENDDIMPALMERAENALIDMMSSHYRWFWGRAVDDVPYPLSWERSERLLAAMSARFEHWTGRSIEDHIAARTNDPPI